MYKGWCNPGYAVQVQCNDKVIGAWSYINSGNNPEDPEGHGSHTASTTAGNRLTDIVLDAPTIDLNFDISGVAPHANIIVYNACSADGCSNDDLIAALQQAVIDGVDALNYSISGSSASPWVASDEQAFLDLRVAGVFVSASAGNGGPGAATVAHGSPWVTTTAASTHDRALVNAVVGMTGLPGTPGRHLRPQRDRIPQRTAHRVRGQLQRQQPLSVRHLGGRHLLRSIVVCERGNNARVEKAENVLAAGGDGMILVNAASNGDKEIGDGYVIPGVHITYERGHHAQGTGWRAARTTRGALPGHSGGHPGQQRRRDGRLLVPRPEQPGSRPHQARHDGPRRRYLRRGVQRAGKANPALTLQRHLDVQPAHGRRRRADDESEVPGVELAEIQSALMTTAISTTACARKMASPRPTPSTAARAG